MLLQQLPPPPSHLLLSRPFPLPFLPLPFRLSPPPLLLRQHRLQLAVLFSPHPPLRPPVTLPPLPPRPLPHLQHPRRVSPARGKKSRKRRLYRTVQRRCRYRIRTERRSLSRRRARASQRRRWRSFRRRQRRRTSSPLLRPLLLKLAHKGLLVATYVVSFSFTLSTH